MNPWASADQRRWLFLAVLLGGVVGSAAAMVSLHPNKFWTVVLQVVGVLAGAALGNALSRDHSRSLIDQQAGGSIRRLFGQANRLGGTVIALEQHRTELLAGDVQPRADRIADWIDRASTSIRNEIEATGSAIEDWGALAPEVQQAEVEKYKERKKRLPLWQTEGGSDD